LEQNTGQTNNKRTYNNSSYFDIDNNMPASNERESYYKNYNENQSKIEDYQEYQNNNEHQLEDVKYKDILLKANNMLNYEINAGNKFINSDSKENKDNDNNNNNNGNNDNYSPGEFNLVKNPMNSSLNRLEHNYFGNRLANKTKDGFGIQKWLDGTIFKGYFKNNKANGIGFFKDNEDNNYSGYFSDDILCGFGIYSHS
jgi:hypothetical protein